MFEELEAWCREHHVPYVRWSGGYGGEWGAERVVFDGAGEPRSYDADERDRIFVDRATVERLGSVETILAHFDAAEFTLPAALAEKTRAEVYGAPAASRAAFPEDYRLFRGALVLDRPMMRDWLTGHDLIVVIGAAVFDYDMGGVGPITPDDCELILITDDPEEAARAPVGDAVVGNVKLALQALVDSVPAETRDWPQPPPMTFPAPETTDPIQAHALFAFLAEVRPKDGVVVLEASSHSSAMHIRMPITSPRGFYYAGVGGVGNGLPTAVGVQLGDPSRRVICATGDGAMLYTCQALWTAAQHRAPVVVLVLDNAGYTVLEECGDYLGVGHGLPGMKAPGIDLVKLAESFGVPAFRIERYADLAAGFDRALAHADGPILVSIAVDATLRPLLS